MSAVAEIPAPTLSPLTQRLANLDRPQRMRLGAGIALLVVGALIAVLLGRQPDYKVLYTNLADKDGGAIVAQLSQMNVPYKYTEGGGAIMVPADKVHDTRLRLASLGLPKGSVVGFELMEANRFGMTQFQERLAFQRGLEGELTRSIQALSSVSSARVHLALPSQNGFFREQQKPSASILVSLQPGQSLDRTQLAGIVHLVASSVPELLPSAVSVLDDTGKLLSQSPDGTGGADAEQLQYVQRIEQQYSRRILDMLEPIVGRQNVKAQVTAEVDFSQTESTAESHRPNLATDASAVRSQQVVETGGGAQGSPQPSGIPGATSNQPPASAAAPINGPAVALTAAGSAGAAAAGGPAAGAKRESVTNYEVDKTVRVVRGGSGSIKRLSAAVVVNHAVAADEKGQPTTKALSEQQIEQMTALVRESIGFNKDRGDSVNLMNAPFLVDVPVVDNTPLWKQPETLEMARNLAWPVGTVLLALLVILGLVRPALKAMAEPKPVPVEPAALGPDGQPLALGMGPLGGPLDALVAGDTPRGTIIGPDGIQILAPTDHQLRLEDARQLARTNSTAVANIVKNWINGED
ncbi:flagellar basal-body MS-ring/collar protein FliF [Rhodoferax sp.]|uniref:flagellar basal-body MS-ring/collar protein FliF n=1 Tax=Rhodoferax sp. TaxID=50421 RepID=UPI0025E7F797|nr:flagellar basal-body MS-ring/collar protein FliF [Rhodoferax sp.]